MRISDWSSDVCSSDLLARTTPGLSIRNGWGDSTKISIRGIASSVGTATTGIYIDDTPIQVRSLGAADLVANVYPEVFDLERTEEIGRASCRERVCQYGSISVVAVSLKTQTPPTPTID